jgi:hypothetical protein
MTTHPDGNLPAARRHLHNAVHALTAPQPHMLNNKIRYTDSRYTQLAQSVAGVSRARSGGTGRLPFWTDAFDLLTKIDRTTRSWYHGPTPEPTTVDQLLAMTRHRWRPQDTHLINQHARDIDAWTASIDALLIDNHHKELDAACPHCNTRTVQRHKDGELVRQAALQLGVDGCRCLGCHDFWPQDLLPHLAQLIGCDTPTGVLA